MSHLKSSLVLLAIALVAIAGCGQTSEVGAVPVTGTITLDGSPVDGAAITFIPKGEGGRSASGLTDTEGKFTLTTVASGDGAIPGEYRVSISKTPSAAAPAAKAGGETPSPEEMMKMMQDAQAKAKSAAREAVKNAIPAKYTDANTSGLDREVVSGSNDFAFELTSS